MITEVREKQELGEARPEDRLEPARLFRQPPLEELPDQQADRAVVAKRRGDQPVRQRPVARIVDVGNCEWRKTRALQHRLQAIRGLEPKPEPRNVLA